MVGLQKSPDNSDVCLGISSNANDFNCWFGITPVEELLGWRRSPLASRLLGVRLWFQWINVFWFYLSTWFVFYINTDKDELKKNIYSKLNFAFSRRKKKIQRTCNFAQFVLVTKLQDHITVDHVSLSSWHLIQHWIENYIVWAGWKHWILTNMPYITNTTINLPSNGSVWRSCIKKNAMVT